MKVEGRNGGGGHVGGQEERSRMDEHEVASFLFLPNKQEIQSLALSVASPIMRYSL